MLALIPILLSSIEMIGILMAILGLAFIANTVLGIAKSTTTHKFQMPIFLHGLKKGLYILLGIFLATTIVSTIPPVFALYGITIVNTAALESIGLIGVVGPIATAIIIYTKDAISKIADLLKIKSENLVEIDINRFVS